MPEHEEPSDLPYWRPCREWGEGVDEANSEKLKIDYLLAKVNHGIAPANPLAALAAEFGITLHQADLLRYSDILVLLNFLDMWRFDQLPRADVIAEIDEYRRWRISIFDSNRPEADMDSAFLVALERGGQWQGSPLRSNGSADPPIRLGDTHLDGISVVDADGNWGDVIPLTPERFGILKALADAYRQNPSRRIPGADLEKINGNCRKIIADLRSHPVIGTVIEPPPPHGGRGIGYRLVWPAAESKDARGTQKER